MSKASYIETNKVDGFLYSVLLFDNRKNFDNQLELINKAGLRQVIFDGTTKEMMNQDGKIVLGSRVKFHMDQHCHDGEVSSLANYPYYEVKPDLQPLYRHSVHKRYVESGAKSTKQLADMFIHKLAENKYQHYELGLLKLNDRVHKTSVDSLANIAKKGKYIIMLKQELT